MKRLSGLVSGYVLAGLAILAGSPGPVSGQAPLQAGTVIETISCQGAPDQRYALYLPSGYRPDRAWPVLYALDARGDGKRVAEVFQAGAERYGWVVASSYNSASDLSVDPNPAALRAMWTDTHARLALDDRRVYVAGYSGTVRSAIRLALVAPGSIVGIFGAGAGFPFERPPAKGDPFDFFGTVGTRDFNYYEMLDLERNLAALSLPFRIDVFTGDHDWPPPELAACGIGWLELRAMQRGLREKDAGLIDALWAADLEQARTAEAAGRGTDALRTWSAMRSSYAGLRDTAEAERKAAELAASAAVQREIAQREERIRRDKAYLAEAPRIFNRAMSGGPDAPPPTAARIAAELKITEWKKRAASADVEESLSAQRVLNTLSGQTGFYLPTLYIERKEWDKAILMLSVAAEIHPDNPRIWVSIAKTNARKGKAGRKRALEALEKAVALGWTDRALIDGEPVFDELRQDKRFQEIVGKMAAGGSRG
jgi:tetratricopeptide (TPR) repeat protein